MDSSVALVAAAVALILIILLLSVLKKQIQPGNIDNVDEAAQQEAAPGIRRAVAGRNNRVRNRFTHRNQENAGMGNLAGDGNDEGSYDEDESPASLLDLGDMKIGKKKMAKLEAKAEKKAAREAEERERQERREREAEREKERKAEEDLEKQLELEKEEQLKKEILERERQEHENYLLMKAAFTVDEQGFEAGEEVAEENLLQRFIDYVKETKIVMLEELAATFQLKTQDAIDRLQKLVHEGKLTGVIDDRGKFIYISRDEMEAVAKFIRQRGRISLSDLAESSNQLITLAPKDSTSQKSL
uniref:DDRGK domain-containing protein 1 n=1 Tax=Evadne anonyx TaxID=141404 RepID=A0A9N6WYH7_9CRUS|nr:EOG090X0N9E [Evadne anonyx]